MRYPCLFMAKLKRSQRESYKKTLANARYLKNEAKAIYKDKLLYDVYIPTLKQLDKMAYADVKNIMRDLRNLMRPSDLVKKSHTGGAAYSVFEEKKIRRQHKQAEERRAERRALLPEEQIPGLMGSEIETQTRPIKLNIENVGQKEFERIAKRLESETSEEEKQRKSETYYSNYMAGIYNLFGEMADLDEIYSKLEQIPYESFDMITGMYEYLAMDFWYSDPSTLQERYNSFIEDLDRAVEHVTGKG
nr:MAG TPA: hypothetical protein [Caudoviricetes sp.]